MNGRKKIDLNQVGVKMDAAGIPGVSIATVYLIDKTATVYFSNSPNGIFFKITLFPPMVN